MRIVPDFIPLLSGANKYRPTYWSDFLTIGSLPSWITYSGPSLATLFDSTGKLTYKPNNLLLNSATLSTQNVTSAPINYILSFYGTGTVTLSGTASHALVGTGVSDRVYYAFTPTAGTLTCTVSGSVTSAQLEAVTYQTTPSTYNATTASAYYGPRFDYDPVTLAAKGLLIEEARTNVATYSNTFSDISWAQANVTSVTQNATGIDGVTNSAWTLTASGAGACTLTKTVTLATGNTLSIYAKVGTDNFVYLTQTDAGGSKTSYFNVSTGALGTQNVTSAGAPTIAQSGGTITSVGGGIYRISITSSGASVTSFAIGMSDADNSTTVTAAKTTIITYCDFTLGSFVTSTVPTAASAVARSADVVTLNDPALTIVEGNQWSAIFEYSYPDAPATNVNRIIFEVGHPGVAFVELGQQSALVGQGYSVYNGSYQANYTFGSDSAGVVSRIGAAIQINNFRAARNGVLSTLDTSGTIGAMTASHLGSTDTNNGFLSGYIRSFAIYNTRIPDVILQAKSVVGAAY